MFFLFFFKALATLQTLLQYFFFFFKDLCCGDTRLLSVGIKQSKRFYFYVCSNYNAIVYKYIMPQRKNVCMYYMLYVCIVITVCERVSF